MLQANLNYPCNNPCKRKVSRKAFFLAWHEFFFLMNSCVWTYILFIYLQIFSNYLLDHVMQYVLIPYQYFKSC